MPVDWNLSRRAFAAALASGAPVAAAVPNVSFPSTAALRKSVVESAVSVGLHRARTFTRIWQENETKPWVLKKALALREYLRTVPLYLRPGDRIAGSISERPGAMPIIVELGIAENPIYTGEDPAARGYLRNQAPGEIREYWRDRNLWGQYRATTPGARTNGPLPEETSYKFISNQGHLSPAYSDLLKHGLAGPPPRAGNPPRPISKPGSKPPPSAWKGWPIGPSGTPNSTSRSRTSPPLRPPTSAKPFNSSGSLTRPSTSKATATRARPITSTNSCFPITKPTAKPGASPTPKRFRSPKTSP